MSAAKVLPFTPDSVETKAAMNRYRSEYQAADASLSLADSIRYGSIFVAGVVFIGTVLFYQTTRSERFGFPVISLSLISASILIVLGAHLWSMLLRIHARRLRMTIDAAVNSSPFLSDMQRARIMYSPSAAAWGEEKKKAA